MPTKKRMQWKLYFDTHHVRSSSIYSPIYVAYEIDEQNVVYDSLQGQRQNMDSTHTGACSRTLWQPHPCKYMCHHQAPINQLSATCTTILLHQPTDWSTCKNSYTETHVRWTWVYMHANTRPTSRGSRCLLADGTA